MKHLIISFFVSFSLLIISCNTTTDPHLNLNILEHVYYENLSSASGVSVENGTIFLTGDDIPWLVELDNDLKVRKRIRLSGIDSIVNGRTPSTIKADYECMETFEDDGLIKTLVLSSGSKVNSRDTAVLFTHGDSSNILKRNIRPIFEKIKTKAEMGDEEINIEGLAIAGVKAYLFHRGNISGNFIAEMNKNDFLHYLQTGHYHDLSINIHRFDLPKLNGVPSGFSGACYLQNNHSLLFTASMEDTKSVTADGEVSGSYIGSIPIKSIEKAIYHSTLLKKEGKILAKKLEGICIKKAQGNEMDAITVCDNDDGTSDLFLIRIK